MAIRKLAAETLGTALLLISVVGSGQMATNLTEDVALQLLINSVVTSLTLFVIITLLAGISGAQFNPVVTLIALYQKSITVTNAIAYIICQVVGALIGVFLANAMFENPIIYMSQKDRTGFHLLLSEAIATAGLVFVIFTAIARKQTQLIPVLVSAWIGGAYFFTSSTSFANPAVTFARSFTDTFSGISIASAPAFIGAQVIGALIGFILVLLISVDPANRNEKSNG